MFHSDPSKKCLALYSLDPSKKCLALYSLIRLLLLREQCGRSLRQNRGSAPLLAATEAVLNTIEFT